MLYELVRKFSQTDKHNKILEIKIMKYLNDHNRFFKVLSVKQDPEMLNEEYFYSYYQLIIEFKKISDDSVIYETAWDTKFWLNDDDHMIESSHKAMKVKYNKHQPKNNRFKKRFK